MTKNKKTPKNIEVAKRRIEVNKYRGKHPSATSQEIGDALGIPAGMVRLDLMLTRKAAVAEVATTATSELTKTLRHLQKAADTADEMIAHLRSRLDAEHDNSVTAAVCNSINGSARVLLDVAKRLESIYGLAAPKKVQAVIDIRIATMVNLALSRTEEAILRRLKDDPVDSDSEPVILDRLGDFRKLLPKYLEEAEEAARED